MGGVFKIVKTQRNAFDFGIINASSNVVQALSTQIMGSQKMGLKIPKIPLHQGLFFGLW